MIEQLKTALARSVTFHCTQRGGGKDRRDFPVVHDLFSPLSATDVPNWAPRSLSTIYTHWNGLRLFQPASGEDDGFRLFAVDDIEQERESFRNILEESADLFDDDEEVENYDEWVNGLIPIAEIMASGDVFVLDTFRPCDDGEFPILYLDHEFYYGGSIDPDETEVVARNAVEFLLEILDKPLNYVAAHWVGNDHKCQWYPDSATVA